MTDRIKIYLIGFDASIFESDIHCIKKMKSLDELEIKLNAVFAKNFKKMPVVKRYCSNHKIETINLVPDEQNFFYSIIRYSLYKNDKKNLAALVPEKMISKLNYLFKQDGCFEPHII